MGKISGTNIVISPGLGFLVFTLFIDIQINLSFNIYLYISITFVKKSDTYLSFLET